MFGDNVIMVSKTLRIDQKRRIVLPIETGAIVSDKVCFMLNPSLTKLSLYEENMFNQRLDGYLSKIDRIHKEGRLSYKDVLRYKRYICAILSYPYEVVDKQRRLLIPESAKDKMNFNDTLFAVGNGNSLELYRNEEEYERIKLGK